MKKISVLPLYSSLRVNSQFISEKKAYLDDLFSRIGMEFEYVDEEGFAASAVKVVYITSGGTAFRFRQISANLEGPFYFITTPTENSLAASMEILAYLMEAGKRGEIIHGSVEQSSDRLGKILQATQLHTALHETRFAVVGYPDLISSSVNTELLKKNFGIELVGITMEEFYDEIRKGEYVANKYTDELKTKEFDPEQIEEGLVIYGSLRRLVDRYQADGIAVRCFDLLDSFKHTGCLGLAILNAEGVWAACEADTRSLLSMFILGRLAHSPTFMANPSVIDVERKEIVLAHCTLPLDMPESYSLMTHFESGIGIGVKGELDEGVYTLFKCWENGDYFVQRGQLLENLASPFLCRTQVKLKVDDVQSYLTKPLSNHQILCKGDHVELVEEFFKQMG